MEALSSTRHGSNLFAARIVRVRRMQLARPRRIHLGSSNHIIPPSRSREDDSLSAQCNATIAEGETLGPP